MTYLLDVNVLLALMDSQHVSHSLVHEWFEQEGAPAWASCPITENGFIRILSNPRYPNPVASASEAAALLAVAANAANHEFWPDDVSFVSSAEFRLDRLLTSSSVTDTYLLALCKKHRGVLATLDRRMSADAVVGGAQALHIIGSSGR